MTVYVELNGDSIMFGYNPSTPNMKLPIDTAGALKLVRPAFVINDKSACGLRLRQLVTGYQTPNDGTPAEAFPKGPQAPFSQIDHHAQVVVVGLGLCDAFDLSITPAQFNQDLNTVIDVIHSQNRVALICNLVQFPDFSGAGNYQQLERCKLFNSIINQVVTQKGGSTLLVNWAGTYQGPQDIQADEVHRTQDATHRLGEAIASKIFHFGLPVEP